MREILFRGKRIDNEEWVEGNYVYASVITRDEPSVENIIRKHWIITLNGKCYEVDPSTVGQFTGLTNKNGKKIFEGDILRCGNIKGVVKYSNKRAAFTFKWKRFTFHGGDFFKECNLADFGELSGLEVIGNIRDNPELLEVSCDD